MSLTSVMPFASQAHHEASVIFPTMLFGTHEWQGRGAVGNEEPVAVLIRNQHHRFSKTLAFLFGDFTVCMMTRYPYYFILGILSSGTDLPVKC